MDKEKLINNLIDNFSLEKLNDLMQGLDSSFKPAFEDLSIYLKDTYSQFSDLVKLGESENKKQGYENLILFACKYNGELTERSSKKSQFDIAKTVLKQDFKDGAIFVFYDEIGNFRFSFIKRFYGDTKQKFTNWKRYTYFVSKAQTNRTFIERITKYDFTTLDSILEAFSVEKLSKQFFNDYKVHYQQFVLFLTGTIYEKKSGKWVETKKQDPDIQFKTIFNNDKLEARNFCKKLLGRIVFLYFIQKKKWLGASDTKYLDGDENFIYNFFEKSGKNQDFYSSYLSDLFFDTLNTQRPNDDFKMPDGTIVKIPFLNGGLFDLDNNLYRNIIFPEQLFQDLFSFFNQYNFTIYEDDPNDHTVAVDPEMLGRIFENLLEDNKEKGAFYTPKEIVHYMCQESLKEYLITKLSEEYEIINVFGSSQTEIFGDEKIGQASMVEHISNDVINSIDVENIVKNKYVENLTLSQIKKIQRHLDDVKICDPAIGSGAFPMSLLLEIYNIKEAIANHLNDEFNPASVKKHIIQNSIYGVDIEKGAVDIARLRFWLSLIVEETYPTPLPNLDYKIVVGNTLIPVFENEILEITWKLDYNRRDITIEDYISKNKSLLNELSHLHIRYFNTSNDKKFQIADDINKLKIDILINQLQIMITKNGIKTEPDRSNKNYKKLLEQYNKTKDWEHFIKILERHKSKNDKIEFFDWKLNFPEILNENLNKNAGFDIVIANPPYGFRTVLSKSEKTYFRKIRKIEFSSGDSAELFVKICFNDLIKRNGIQTFIIPKKSLYGDAWEDTRINYWKKYNLVFILDTGKSFDNVLLEATVFSLKKEYTNKLVKVSFLSKEGIEEVGIFSIDEIYAESNTLQIYKAIYPKSLINKIDNKKYNEVVAEGKLGLGIGTNFFSDTEKDYKLLKGIDIQRFHIRSHRYLNNHHLLKLENIEQFLKPKVIVQRLVAHIENPIPHLKITATYDKEGIVITNTLMSFEIDSRINEKFFLAYLNSKFVSWYAYNFVYARAIRGMDFYNFYIQQLPIPNISIEKQKPIIQKVEEILNTKEINSQTDTSDLEKEVDQMVYNLFNFTSEEIKIIEGY